MKKAILVIILLIIASVSFAEERPEIMFRNREGKNTNQTSLKLPVDAWKAPARVGFKQVGNDIQVYLNTSTLTFSGSTINIRDAKVLGTQMVQTPQPNLVLVTPDGTRYTQNLSKSGKLDAFDDGEYINVFGRFTLTSSDSKTSLTPDIWYKIDKNNGYTQVRYSLYGNVKKSDPPIEIMKLYVDTIVGNVDYNKVDHFWQGCGVQRNSEWEPWQSFAADVSQNKVQAADKCVNMMMVCNARMGFAMEPVTFDGNSVDPGLDGYLNYLTEDRQHIFRYIYINHKSSPYTMKMPIDIQFTMCYLPTREYRISKMLFYTGAWVPYDECARVGIDTIESWDSMGWPFDSKKNLDRMVEMNRKIHSYGLKHAHFCVNWYPQNGANGRYPEPYSETAEHDQLFVYGKKFNWGSPDQPLMCLNSKGWYDEYYQNVVHNVTDLDADGLRMDCCTPSMCKNTAHGCSKDYSCETLAYYNFEKAVNKFHKAMSAKTGREYILGGATNIQPCVNTYLDFALTGEGAAGYPTEDERDANFTVFLYGREVAQLVGGNTPVDISSPKIYEMLASRCATMTYLTSLASEAATWMKYTNPLKIFDVYNTEVHHPFHADYSKYTKAWSDKFFPIIYSRKNEALAVVCNESDMSGEGDLYLNTRNLNLPDRILVYKPFMGVYKIFNSTNGSVKFNIHYPKKWDMDYYFIRTVPKNPEIIWHDVRVHQINQNWNNGILSIKTKGMLSEALPSVDVMTAGSSIGKYEEIHDAASTYSCLDLYTAGKGCPVIISGGELLSYSPDTGMAKIKIIHNKTGINEVRIKFDTKKSLTKNLDIAAIYGNIMQIRDMLNGMNYRKKDKDSLQGWINQIRRNSKLIPPDRREEILTNITDVERLIYAVDEVKFYDKYCQKLADRIKSNKYHEQEWSVIGPFGNDDSAFGFAGNTLPEKLDFSAGYNRTSGKTAAVQFTSGAVATESGNITGKNAVGYYLDFNILAKKPVLSPVGTALKDMTAFASARFMSDTVRKARLSLSGIGGIKVWVNGNLLNTEGTELKSDQKSDFDIELKKGENIITYKMVSGPENWEVYTQVFDAGGKDLGESLKFTPVQALTQKAYAHPFYLNINEMLNSK